MIAPNVCAVAAEIGYIPGSVAETAGVQVTAHITEIASEIDAVVPNIASIGTDVCALSMPSGRCHGWREGGTPDGSCSHKHQDQFSNHDDPPVAICPQVQPAPLKRTRAEPPVCRGFIIDLSTLSFRNVDDPTLLARLFCGRIERAKTF